MRLRSRIALIGAALMAFATGRPCVAASGPTWCLPPLFEGGERLHSLPAAGAWWLAPLLRQHQLCHAARDRPDEPRVVLLGNSAVLGHPLPVDATLSGRLNAALAARGTAGRVFNLGWVNCYELRDAVVLSAALEYRPDLIIYPLTLDDFQHAAPALFGPIAAFFDSNDTRALALAAAQTDGLEEPFERYRLAFDRQGWTKGHWARLMDVGALVRAGARAHAQRLARWIDPTYSTPTYHTKGRRKTYDCSQTIDAETFNFRNWQSWNILAYLQQLQQETGVAVLVVNWPVAHEPVGECYNIRHSAAAYAEFNAWLPAEAAARGLGYVDLHDLLAPELFFDSIHPTADGHRRIAEKLVPAVEAALALRANSG